MNILALKNKNKEDIDTLENLWPCLLERFSDCHGHASLNDGSLKMSQGTHNRILHWNKQRFSIKSAQCRQSSWNLADGQEYGKIDRMLKRVTGLKFSLQLSKHKTLGKLFPCSKSQFPHWQNKANNAKPEELWWERNTWTACQFHS